MAEDNVRRVKSQAEKDVEKLSEELNVPDEYKGLTAQEVVAQTGFRDPLAGEGARRAEEAGVTKPEYVNYEEALKKYESRPDVESLADRRARENGGTFEAASFRRSVDSYRAPGTVTSANTQNDGKQENQENRRTSENNPVGKETTDPKAGK